MSGAAGGRLLPRLWLSLALRDEHGEWEEGLAWLRLEGHPVGDPEGVVAGPQPIDRADDLLEQAEAWAAGYQLRPARWQLTAAGAVAWLDHTDGDARGCKGH